LLKVDASWEISPQSEEKRAASGFKSRDGEENGSRIYQLLLHEMLLLPSNIPAYNRVPCENEKGKKHVLVEPDLRNDDNIGMSKKMRMAPNESPADIEMTDTNV
jgi:hypothetical protein